MVSYIVLKLSIFKGEKLMLNKWRRVGYTDDGCVEYECLACYKRQDTRSFYEHFCPNCGTKWEGQHLVYSVKEKYGDYEHELNENGLGKKRYKAYALIRKLYDKGIYPKRVELRPTWEIESRCVGEFKTNWSRDSMSYTMRDTSAFDVYDRLKRMREEDAADDDEYFRKEYRVVLVKVKNG